MTFAWTNRWPANRAPELNTLASEAREAEILPGTKFTARIDATDPEGDPLFVRWEVRSESADRREGGDHETEPMAHPECFVAAKGLGATFRRQPGPGPTEFSPTFMTARGERLARTFRSPYGRGSSRDEPTP